MTKDINPDIIMDLCEKGFSPKEIGEVVGATPPTIRSRIAEMQKNQGVILQYRQLQDLRLTELQHAVLEAMTLEKIADAPLSVLVQAFKILKDKELVANGKPTDIKGLVGYLLEVEKMESAIEVKNDNDLDSNFIEMESSSTSIPDLH